MYVLYIYTYITHTYKHTHTHCKQKYYSVESVMVENITFNCPISYHLLGKKWSSLCGQLSKLSESLLASYSVWTPVIVN